MPFARDGFVGLACFLSVALALSAADPKAPEKTELPSFRQIEQTAHGFFQQQRDFRPDDILSQSQVDPLAEEIQKLGWDTLDKPSLLASTLADDHVLVRTLRTPAGRRFLGKVSSRELIYDRLDRVSGVYGGARLIQDLVKLPDGEKYAKPKSGGGVPDLLDLLPKTASGKTRRIENYDQPTKKIYTVDQLIVRLRELYDAEVAARKTP